MTKEALTHYRYVPPVESEPAPAVDPDDEELISADDFDLGSFFAKPVEHTLLQANNVEPAEIAETATADLFVTLKDTAQESIVNLTKRVTADTFTTGAALTSQVFSSLGSFVGSCGLFCAHGLGAVAQAGSGMSGLSGLGGLGNPGFSVDTNGNFHLEGDVNTLAKATGISRRDLVSGKFSAAEILSAIFTSFGEGVSMLFGFGMVEGLIDSMFGSIMTKAA